MQISAELDVGESAFGLAFAAYFATAAVGSIALGRFAERVGARAALTLAPLLSMGLQLGVAWMAETYAVFLLLLALAGASNALAQPAANLALARAVPRERQGFAFGLKQSAIPICTLLGGLAVPVFGVGAGWRWAFVTGAGLALMAALTAWFGPLPSGASASFPTAEETETRPALRATCPDGTVPAAAPSPGVLGVLALGIGFGAAAAGALAAFLVATGVHAGLSEAAAGTWLTVGSGCGLLVRLASGVVADRFPVRPLRVVVVMLVVGTAAFAALGLGLPWLHRLATPIAFGAGWAWPGLFNLAVVRAFPTVPARATGVTQTGTYLGAVVGPLMFGVLAERSYFVAWMVATAMMVAAAVALSAADRRLQPPG